MGINAGILEKALSRLPSPEYEGAVLQLEAPSRAEVLEQMQPIGDEGINPPNDVKLFRHVVCVAKRYCDGRECWLEWELDL